MFVLLFSDRYDYAVNPLSFLNFSQPCDEFLTYSRNGQYNKISNYFMIFHAYNSNVFI